MRRANGARAALAAAMVGVAAMALGPMTATATESFSGRYLSARHAIQKNDIDRAAFFLRRALLFKADDRSLRGRALFFSVAAGDMVDAIELARATEAAGETNFWSTLVLGVDDLQAERFQAAYDRFATTEDPSQASLMSALLANWAAEGLDDAASNWGAVPRGGALAQHFARYHAALAELLRDDPETAAALFEVDEALGDPDNLTARAARTYVAALSQSGRREEAAEIVARMVARAPTDLVVERLRQDFEAAGEDGVAPPVASIADAAAELVLDFGALGAREPDSRAILFYAQLALHLRPEFDDARMIAGEALDRLDQFGDAADLFSEVPEGSPHRLNAQLNYALLLNRLQMPVEAIDALDAMTDTFPERPRVFFTLGLMHSASGNYAECVDSYRDGLALVEAPGPRHVRAFFQKGACLDQSGDWPAAEATFVRALEIEPDNADTLNYLGYTLVERGERLDEALKMIETAVAKRPEGYIIDSLGWAHYKLGDFDEAVKQLEAAVAKDPTEPVINDHFGDALWMVGRQNEARFQWKRSLSFEPADKDRERILRKLDVGLDVVLAEEATEAETKKAESEADAEAPSTPDAPADVPQGG